MAIFTVDIPIIGYLSTTVEFDGDENELLDAIENDEVDIPVNLSMLDSWQPVHNIYQANETRLDIPFKVEVHA